MPFNVSLTTKWCVDAGESFNPAALGALVIEVRRRVMVAEATTRAIGEVESDRLWGCGKKGERVRAAEEGEVFKVGIVRAQGDG
ncbi:MAG: hypothetical protein ACLPH3_07545 [Terracidiphilus sp.]